MNRLYFGKRPSKHDYRTLRFKSYLKSGAVLPPASFDILPRVLGNLPGSTIATLFPMDGNDQYQDCTIAGMAHAITVFEGMIGTLKVTALPDLMKLYFQLSGGQNVGLYELDVLNYWQSNQVDSEQIFAYTAIDPKNQGHIQQAISIFGGIYIGFQVQENCIQDFDNGQPWTPGMLTNDGHCVFVTGYDQNGVTVLTWGGKQQGTWDWWNECVDEAYAILPPQAANINYVGIDMDQLKADLAAVAG